jgi:hypothetical protein
MHPSAINRQAPWSVKSLVMVQSSGRLSITGIVEAWGRVHVHREGFRAEYARPTTLLLIGTRRDSDYGRLVEDIAIRHRAGLLEVEGGGAFVAYCRANGIGMPPETVKSLLAGRDPVG